AMNEMRRRDLLWAGLGALAFPGWVRAMQERPGSARGEARPRPAIPQIDRPIPFHTPEADRILEGLQVFPPDDPWHQDVSRWPVHPNSGKIVASIGRDKPLRYNPDMNFILVPPGQKRVEVKITGYPD